MDLSGSVEARFEMAMHFMTAVINNLDFNFGLTRVGVITYGDHAQMRFPLELYRSKQEVLNAVAFKPDQGKTNTQEALNMMWEIGFTAAAGDRPGVQNVGIHITDGRSNVNQDNTLPEATRAKLEGIEMYSVALGNEVDMDEITGMASDPPSKYVFTVADESEIEEVARKLTIDNLCNWLV